MTAVWCAPSSVYALSPWGNGYEWWEDGGDNHYYTEHICGYFYYYDASFLNAKMAGPFVPVIYVICGTSAVANGFQKGVKAFCVVRDGECICQYFIFHNLRLQAVPCFSQRTVA
jgi:hypothetical protein